MGSPQIGQRIEYRRKQLGLTLDDIATDIGVARSTVQRYEKGAIEKIKLPVIEAIARVLDVSPTWLCCKSDDMRPSGPNKSSLPRTRSRTMSRIWPPSWERSRPAIRRWPLRR